MTQLYMTALALSGVGALITFSAVFLRGEDGKWSGGPIGVLGTWILAAAQGIMYYEHPVLFELVFLVGFGGLALLATAILFSIHRPFS